MSLSSTKLFELAKAKMLQEVQPPALAVPQRGQKRCLARARDRVGLGKAEDEPSEVSYKQKSQGGCPKWQCKGACSEVTTNQYRA